jgi:iron uptake system component EfeO
VRPPTLPAALVTTAALLVGAGCTSNASPSPGTRDHDGTVSVAAGDDSCEVSADRAPSGKVVFDVANEGSEVTEFYLYREDGKTIAGEVENIGPGLNRQLVVNAQPGSYVTACKPGMAGEGIRGEFTVTDAGNDVAESDQQAFDAAGTSYKTYVGREVDQLVAGTEEFVNAYKAGRYDEARRLYASTRVHWERIEPVAESFGDLDARMDLRQADLEQGQTWSGWHLLEKDLWWPADEAGAERLTDAERRRYADQLMADTHDLAKRVDKLEYAPDQMANGAKELLDEVATGKVTGEEEIWSHTDLYDFKANVDGAEAAFQSLEPIVEEQDPALAKQIRQRFAELQKLIDTYRRGDGFVSYTALSGGQVKELSDAVNALAEPLSQLTATVLS